MKNRSIYILSLLSFILFFWLPSPYSTWIPGGQAEQGLGWKLVGTAIGNGPGGNFAILKNQSTGGQGAFHEGDRLDGILIKKIVPGYIVINARGGDVTLSLGSDEKPGDFSSSRQLARLDRREVNSTLPEYMQLMKEIRVRPHFEEGRPAGFIIYGIEPGSIFARMGLQNWDIIIGVNGKPIATTLQAMDFYEALKAGGTISLKIKRGDSQQELDFAIE